jgi:hypothetical protein
MNKIAAARLYALIDSAYKIVHSLHDPLRSTVSPKKYDTYLTKLAVALRELSDIRQDIFHQQPDVHPDWENIKAMRRDIRRTRQEMEFQVTRDRKGNRNVIKGRRSRKSRQRRDSK